MIIIIIIIFYFKIFTLTGQNIAPVNLSLSSEYQILEFSKITKDTINRNDSIGLKKPNKLIQSLMNVSLFEDMERVTLDTNTQYIRVNANNLNKLDIDVFIPEYWMKIKYKEFIVGIFAGAFYPDQITRFGSRDIVIMVEKDEEWYYKTIFELTSLNLFLKNTNKTIIDAVIENGSTGNIELDNVIKETIIYDELGRSVVKPDVFRRIIRDLRKKKDVEESDDTITLLLNQLLFKTGDIISLY